MSKPARPKQLPLSDRQLAAIVSAGSSDPATTDAAAKQLDRLARAYRYRRDVRAGLKPTNHQDGFLSQAEAARASGLWRNRIQRLLAEGRLRRVAWAFSSFHCIDGESLSEVVGGRFVDEEQSDAPE